MIRSELLTSKTLKAVPPEVELTFIHLLLVADDYGRFDADPDVLASALYPTRREITPRCVMQHLQQLADGDDPAIRFYRVEGREYLCLTGWEAHRSKAKRGDTSKYPAPPAEPLVDPRAPADPRGSPRIPEDPQPGSEYRVASIEYRVARDGFDASPSAPPPAPKPARRTRMVPLPNPIPPELHSALAKQLAAAGVDPDAFWAAARNWAERLDKRYAGTKGWSLALQSAIRESWAWVPKSPVARASPPNHAERVAERTKEAARNVLRQSQEKSSGRHREGEAVGGPDRDVPRLRAAGD